MKITIKKLSPELIDDYLFFFDNITFTEHPDWSKCYCYSFHFTGEDEEWNKPNNRNEVSTLIKEERMNGYLAYADNKVVGWVNVNDRNNYQRLNTIYQLEENKTEKIASIVCFLIHPDYRRKGISKLFLQRITQDYTAKGYDFLEAYPGKDKHSCEKNYKGHWSMYKSSNFEIISEYKSYLVVRKKLTSDI